MVSIPPLQVTCLTCKSESQKLDPILGVLLALPPPLDQTSFLGPYNNWWNSNYTWSLQFQISLWTSQRRTEGSNWRLTHHSSQVPLDYDCTSIECCPTLAAVRLPTEFHGPGATDRVRVVLLRVLQEPSPLHQAAHPAHAAKCTSEHQHLELYLAVFLCVQL